ncbi:hypothetical protein NDU88_000688 [Pleurodeles waltl]|uniref:Uncharacterized protein n=1 Tax=Pleurodeles waltl TaxID=8319 RepID=A0AAV7VY30_PLEWA|nr:hypothetical protein NDU88_000688 [Pleurodeles waltl]
MTSQRPNKKEGTLKDLFSKPPGKKMDPQQGAPVVDGGAESGACPDDDTTPITKAFLEQLFGVLRDDFATLKQEMAADVKDLKMEIAKFGQRMYTVECTHDGQEEEIDQNWREILGL